MSVDPVTQIGPGSSARMHNGIGDARGWRVGVDGGPLGKGERRRTFLVLPRFKTTDPDEANVIPENSKIDEGKLGGGVRRVGISLGREIIRAHGGEMALENCESEFNQFLVRLPTLGKLSNPTAQIQNLGTGCGFIDDVGA